MANFSPNRSPGEVGSPKRGIPLTDEYLWCKVMFKNQLIFELRLMYLELGISQVRYRKILSFKLMSLGLKQNSGIISYRKLEAANHDIKNTSHVLMCNIYVYFIYY